MELLGGSGSFLGSKSRERERIKKRQSFSFSFFFWVFWAGKMVKVFGTFSICCNVHILSESYIEGIYLNTTSLPFIN